MKSLLSLPVLLALVLAGGAARAQDATIDEAKAHFDAGQRLYEKNEFEKAAAEFKLAYAKKPFAGFLFNAAACREALSQYDKAIELLERYLKEAPKAPDRADVEKWIAALKAEAAAPPAAAPETRPAKGKGSRTTKGMIVIETNPEGASMRLDDPKGEEFARTPWSGQLPEGMHVIHLDLRGFKHEQRVIQPPTQVQFAYYFFRLSEDPEFGFLVVSSNIPDALIYLDREPGVWGRVSSERNLKKGKHHIVVVRDGYVKKEMEIDIKPGQLNTVPVQLEVAAVGFVKVRTTQASTGARVQLDGKEVCHSIPCRFESPEGNHAVAISEQGKKGFARTLRIDRLTESTLQVRLADKPSRLPALGFFIGGAAVAGLGVAGGLFLDKPTAKALSGEDGNRDWENGIRYTFIAVGGAVGAMLIGFGINELVREKGAPSTGTVEAKDLAWVPVITPQVSGTRYAGASASWRW